MLEKREESPDANPRPNFVDWRFDLALGLLEILNRPNRHIDEDVGAILSELQRALDFDSVAICLRKDEAFTIFEGKSQPEMFRGADRKLCEPSVAGGKCLCGHILHGEIDYTLPCFTSRGGFWSNNYASRYREHGGHRQRVHAVRYPRYLRARGLRLHCQPGAAG